MTRPLADNKADSEGFPKHPTDSRITMFDSNPKDETAVTIPRSVLNDLLARRLPVEAFAVYMAELGCTVIWPHRARLGFLRSDCSRYWPDVEYVQAPGSADKVPVVVAGRYV